MALTSNDVVFWMGVLHEQLVGKKKGPPGLEPNPDAVAPMADPVFGEEAV